MIVLEINGEQKRIPQSYSEITLGDFTKLWKIMCKYNLDEPETDDDVERKVVNELNLSRELVGAMLGLKSEDVDKLDVQQTDEVIGLFNRLLEKDELDGDWGNHKFEHNGEEFYFPQHNFGEMSFGEYATIKQYEQVLSKDNGNRFDFIAEQIAYCCRKKGEEKESYDLKERADLFRDVTMDKVLKLTFFLQKRISSLEAITKMYSEAAKIQSEKKLVTS